jgi:ubiquinone/menaquinone biosynthesis C-methylase UbiE
VKAGSSRVLPALSRRHHGGRIGRARWVIESNGIRWAAWAVLFGALQRTTHLIYERMVRLEAQRGLGGRNSREQNYLRFQEFDWSQQGEEWTPSEEWKQTLIDEVMLAHLKPRTAIVEIGPGAGRWTEALQRIAGRLMLVDISDRCIELCRQRFADAHNVEFHVNDGRSLPGMATSSVDGVWSFDVFVHVAPADAQAYIAEIGRVLRPGGRAVVHHPRAGHEDHAADAGWRSSMTADLFADMVRANGLTMVAQFDSWAGGRFDVRKHGDVISVFGK